MSAIGADAQTLCLQHQALVHASLYKALDFLGLPKTVLGVDLPLLRHLGAEVGLHHSQRHLLPPMGLGGDFGISHGATGLAGRGEPSAGIKWLAQRQATTNASDGVGLVQTCRVEVHLRDAGLIELHAEGHHWLVRAHEARRQGDGRQVQILHGVSLGPGAVHHGFTRLKSGLLGPGAADGGFKRQ